MTYFITGLIIVAIFGVLMIAVLAVIGGIGAIFDGHPIIGSLFAICGIVALSAMIGVGVWANDKDKESDARHCGVGTQYRESAQYDPATKGNKRLWWCEAK